MPRTYDISLPISHGGVRYPGNPDIAISPHQSIARGDTANLSLISFGSHTATHVDAARHFIEGGQTADAIPLDRLIGAAVVLAFPDDVIAIGETHLRACDLRGERRVLLKTRNSTLLGRPEFVADYTHLAPDGAEHLVSLGVELVGIDYLSVERFRSGDHRTHLTLLERNVVIVEGLDLREVPAGRYELICLPLKLAGLDGAPARAVLRSTG